MARSSYSSAASSGERTCFSASSNSRAPGSAVPSEAATATASRYSANRRPCRELGLGLDARGQHRQPVLQQRQRALRRQRQPGPAGPPAGSAGPAGCARPRPQQARAPGSSARRRRWWRWDRAGPGPAAAGRCAGGCCCRSASGDQLVGRAGHPVVRELHPLLGARRCPRPGRRRWPAPPARPRSPAPAPPAPGPGSCSPAAASTASGATGPKQAAIASSCPGRLGQPLHRGDHQVGHVVAGAQPFDRRQIPAPAALPVRGRFGHQQLALLQRRAAAAAGPAGCPPVFRSSTAASGRTASGPQPRASPRNAATSSAVSGRQRQAGDGHAPLLQARQPARQRVVGFGADRCVADGPDDQQRRPGLAGQQQIHQAQRVPVHPAQVVQEQHHRLPAQPGARRQPGTPTRTAADRPRCRARRWARPAPRTDRGWPRAGCPAAASPAARGTAPSTNWPPLAWAAGPQPRRQAGLAHALGTGQQHQPRPRRPGRAPRPRAAGRGRRRGHTAPGAAAAPGPDRWTPSGNGATVPLALPRPLGVLQIQQQRPGALVAILGHLGQQAQHQRRQPLGHLGVQAMRAGWARGPGGRAAGPATPGRRTAARRSTSRSRWPPARTGRIGRRPAGRCARSARAPRRARCRARAPARRRRRRS